MIANRGRFLVSVLPPDGQMGSPDDVWWCELDESQGKDVIRHALTTRPQEDVVPMTFPDLEARKCGWTASLLRRSASESTTMEDKKKTTLVVSSESLPEGAIPPHLRAYSPQPPVLSSPITSSASRQVQMSRHS